DERDDARDDDGDDDSDALQDQRTADRRLRIMAKLIERRCEKAAEAQRAQRDQAGLGGRRPPRRSAEWWLGLAVVPGPGLTIWLPVRLLPGLRGSVLAVSRLILRGRAVRRLPTGRLSVLSRRERRSVRAIRRL